MGNGLILAQSWGLVSWDFNDIPNSTNTRIYWWKNSTASAANWPDYGRWNNDLIQTSAGNQPQVVDPPSTTAGTAPDFEENDEHFYDLTHQIDLPAERNWLICFACKLESHDDKATMFSSDITTGGGHFIEFKDEETIRVKSNAATTIIKVTGGAVWAAGSDFVLTLYRDSNGAFTVYKNTSKLTIHTGTSTNYTDNDGSFELNNMCSKHGTSRYFDGLVYEVVLANQVDSLADADILKVATTMCSGLDIE